MTQSGLEDSIRGSTIPSLAGQKRKRQHEKKYYAVQVGKEPGVYDAWDRCLAQVKGQKGAVFKSFWSFDEAQAFAEGTLTQSSDKSSGPPKFYAVQNGRVPGVYTDWLSAQAQISGVRNPKYKKFNTREEAEAFVTEGKAHGQTRLELGLTPDEARKRSSAPGMVLNGEYIAKDKQGQVFELGKGPLPPGAEDGYDPNIKLAPDGSIVQRTSQEKSKTKLVPVDSEPSSMLRIYTDGSSLKNGQAGARAGVGVFFGPQDPKNVSEALKGSRQTNQRAELTAIQRALDIAPRHRDVTIFTDSKYSIDCVTNWYRGWLRNGWLNAKGKPVENKDLVQEIREKMDERELLAKKTLFVWVKGHASDVGNIAADRLAVRGAMLGRGLQIEGDDDKQSTRDNDAEGAEVVSNNSPDNYDSEDPEVEASLQLMKEAMEGNSRDENSR